jgi:hypothetical protein
VEEFNSKLNRIMDDLHRRGLGSDHAEDTLRVAQNGVPPDQFDGFEMAPMWSACFGHRNVKSKADKDKCLEKSTNSRTKKRKEYHDDAEFRANKKRKQVTNYFRKKLVLTVGRGLVQPPVRKSLKKKRAALRRQGGHTDGAGAEDEVFEEKAEEVEVLDEEAEEVKEGEAEENEEDEAEDKEEAGDLQEVLEQVCSALGAKVVHLQTLMPANRVQHKDLHFLFVDGDDAVQLGQIKKIYLANSKAAKGGFTAEVKFTTAKGRQDLNLAVERYDPLLQDVGSWVLLVVEK